MLGNLQLLYMSAPSRLFLLHYGVVFRKEYLRSPIRDMQVIDLSRCRNVQMLSYYMEMSRCPNVELLYRDVEFWMSKCRNVEMSKEVKNVGPER